MGEAERRVGAVCGVRCAVCAGKDRPKAQVFFEKMRHAGFCGMGCLVILPNAFGRVYLYAHIYACLCAYARAVFV